MRPIVIILLMVLCLPVRMKAQNYMEHLREHAAGQGTVTVIQSKEIDELVNGKIPEVVPRPVEKVPESKEETAPKTVIGYKTHDGKGQTIDADEELDSRKKVMVGSVKVTGYRVQVFAGGNSRADRQKAQRIGNEIKRHFPEYPVYVHFYSPRWICRMGNFRSLDEANAILKEIRELGYRAACVVKGTITVQR